MHRIGDIERFGIWGATFALTLVFLGLAFLTPWAWAGVMVFGALMLLGLHDVIQTKHAILRNYPVAGHLRFFFEGFRVELRQYLLENDQDENPFSREDRSLVYQRAKGDEDKLPYGTKRNVYGAGYEWLTHSVRPVHIADSDFRVTIGGPDCSQPYNASIYNISAMSFGACRPTLFSPSIRARRWVVSPMTQARAASLVIIVKAGVT